MKADRTGVLIVSGLVALGLGACGGSGSDSGSSESPPDTSAATSTPTTAEKPASSGGLTPPGATLKFGEPATVGWVPSSEYSVPSAQKGKMLKVTVDSIEAGSIGDFDNVELEPDEAESTPYYMHVTIESLGEIPASVSDDPDITVTAIDDRGQEQGSVTFFGDFPTCEDAERPETFKSGESYESCLTYLMPGGGSIEKAQWNNGPSSGEDVTPYFEEPIIWSATG